MYPRSGAEYVFLSRSLHPAVGFAVSFIFTFWQIFYVGLNGAFLSIYAIQSTIAAIGVQGNRTRTSSTWRPGSATGGGCSCPRV